jgi:hypothetical protein
MIKNIKREQRGGGKANILFIFSHNYKRIPIDCFPKENNQ